MLHSVYQNVEIFLVFYRLHRLGEQVIQPDHHGAEKEQKRSRYAVSHTLVELASSKLGTKVALIPFIFFPPSQLEIFESFFIPESADSASDVFVVKRAVDVVVAEVADSVDDEQNDGDDGDDFPDGVNIPSCVQEFRELPREILE